MPLLSLVPLVSLVLRVAQFPSLVLLNQQLQIYRENGRVVKDIWESKYLVPIKKH